MSSQRVARLHVGCLLGHCCSAAITIRCMSPQAMSCTAADLGHSVKATTGRWAKGEPMLVGARQPSARLHSNSRCRLTCVYHSWQSALVSRLNLIHAGKDVFWYTKGKGDSGVSQDELEAVKAREREMMAEVSAGTATTCSSVC